MQFMKSCWRKRFSKKGTFSDIFCPSTIYPWAGLIENYKFWKGPSVPMLPVNFGRYRNSGFGTEADSVRRELKVHFIYLACNTKSIIKSAVTALHSRNQFRPAEVSKSTSRVHSDHVCEVWFQSTK